MAAKTAAQKKARDKYDSENMTYQTIKISKSLLTDFKKQVTNNGEKVNTVFRNFMIDYTYGNSETENNETPGN